MRYTVGLPEKEYYKIPFAAQPPPKPGFVLLSRRPMSPIFKVTWSQGQSVTIMGDDPNVLRRLDQFGISKDVAERSLQHIWNFQKAYVKLREGYPDAPPVVMPKSALSSRRMLPRTPSVNTGSP